MQGKHERYERDERRAGHAKTDEPPAERAGASSATIALLRAVAVLGPRLHQPANARDADTLNALVCDALRGCGLFVHIAHVEPPAPVSADAPAPRVSLRIAATSVDGEMREHIEELIAQPFVGYRFPATGPYAEVLATNEPVALDDLTAILLPLMPHLSPERRAWLTRGLENSFAIAASIISSGQTTGVFTVWGPRTLLSREDAPAVGALAAQIGIALDNARLLREAEQEREQWRAAMDSTPEFVATFDADAHVHYINPAYARLLGVSPDQTLPPDAFPAYYQLFLPDGSALMPIDQLPSIRAARTNHPVVGIEMLHRGPSGEEHLVLWNASPMRSEDGRRLGVVAMGHDVTESRALEHRTQDALSALLEMAESLVLPGDRISGHGLETTTSHRLADLLRHVLCCERAAIYRVERIGRQLRPVAVSGLPAAREAAWWEKQSRGISLNKDVSPQLLSRWEAGESVLLDDSQPSGDAVAHPLDANLVVSVPMRVAGELVGLLLLGYARHEDASRPNDLRLAGAAAQLVALVVERERLLRQRAEAVMQSVDLRDASRRMDEFLGIAGHELRTPLTVLQANIQIMTRQHAKRAGTPESDRDMPLLSRSQKALERLARLVDDLLDVSRIRAGRLEFREELLDLGIIVRQAVEEQRLANPTRHIALEARPGEQLPVIADADRIGQVITNYLTNALKYSQADRGVSVSVSRAWDEVRVTVHDEGVGIPPEERDHVWDLFHKVPGVTVVTGSGVGLGLGLHLCKTIVERHGGQVGMESELGVGSTFWFTLPLAVEPQD